MKYTNALFCLLIMVAGSMAACAVSFTPASAADCNTGSMTFTATGCTANGNYTLRIGGSALGVTSCSAGTDGGAFAIATGAGAFTCVAPISTSLSSGVQATDAYNINTTTADYSYNYNYGYCARYGVTDVSEATVDTTAGLFDGLSGLSKPLAVSILGLIVVGMLAAMILKLKSLG